MMEAALEGLDAGTTTGSKRPLLYCCHAINEYIRRANETRTTDSGSLQESVLHYATLQRNQVWMVLFVHHMKQQ